MAGNIIRSLADSDLYVLTMQQAVLHQFPDTQVRYEFKCRKPNAGLDRLASRIREEVDAMGELSFQKDELDFMSGLRFIKRDYVDFLRLFRPNPANVDIRVLDDGELKISVVGSWLHTIVWEVPILAIVSELYAESCCGESEPMGDKQTWESKTALLDMRAPSNFRFSEFGTRRRLSRKWHEWLLPQLKRLAGEHLVGTSNVRLAMDNDLTPIGTMAHQWIMAGQGMRQTRLAQHQTFMLEAWAKEYRGDLGYALTDTITMDAFLRDFDLYLAKLFDGGRIDSGDPGVGIDKLVRRYEELRIDPKTKWAIPSDDLDLEKGFALARDHGDRINVSCGIGTFLTNKARPDVPHLPIVMKLASVNGQPVAKISDEPGKATCEDPKFLEYLKGCFGVDG